MTPITMVLVAVAGGLGAACRVSLDHAIARGRPSHSAVGTFVVNISGSLALGALVGLVARASLSPELILVVGGGFLGAYTTFSTWMIQSIRLVERGFRARAAANVLGSAVAGTAAAALGLTLVCWP